MSAFWVLFWIAIASCYLTIGYFLAHIFCSLLSFTRLAKVAELYYVGGHISQLSYKIHRASVVGLPIIVSVLWLPLTTVLIMAILIDWLKEHKNKRTRLQ